MSELSSALNICWFSSTVYFSSVLFLTLILHYLEVFCFVLFLKKPSGKLHSGKESAFWLWAVFSEVSINDVNPLQSTIHYRRINNLSVDNGGFFTYVLMSLHLCFELLFKEGMQLLL